MIEIEETPVLTGKEKAMTNTVQDRLEAEIDFIDCNGRVDSNYILLKDALTQITEQQQEIDRLREGETERKAAIDCLVERHVEIQKLREALGDIIELSGGIYGKNESLAMRRVAKQALKEQPNGQT